MAKQSSWLTWAVAEAFTLSLPWPSTFLPGGTERLNAWWPTATTVTRWISGVWAASSLRCSHFSRCFPVTTKWTKSIKFTTSWAPLPKNYWTTSRSMPLTWSSISPKRNFKVSLNWFPTSPRMVKISLWRCWFIMSVRGTRLPSCSSTLTSKTSEKWTTHRSPSSLLVPRVSLGPYPPTWQKTSPLTQEGTLTTRVMLVQGRPPSKTKASRRNKKKWIKRKFCLRKNSLSWN